MGQIKILTHILTLKQKQRLIPRWHTLLLVSRERVAGHQVSLNETFQIAIDDSEDISEYLRSEMMLCKLWYIPSVMGIITSHKPLSRLRAGTAYPTGFIITLYLQMSTIYFGRRGFKVVSCAYKSHGSHRENIDNSTTNRLRRGTVICH